MNMFASVAVVLAMGTSFVTAYNFALVTLVNEPGMAVAGGDVAYRFR